MPMTTCDRNPSSPAIPYSQPSGIIAAAESARVSAMPVAAAISSHTNATCVCHVAQSGRGSAAGGGSLWRTISLT